MAQEDLKYRRRALLLVALVTIYHLLIIGAFGPGDNEAYYWTWSQHLDWSYFDHPPALAWMIALTTAVGVDSSFFLRIGSAILFIFSCTFIYLLALEVTGSRKAAYFSLLLANIIPLFFLAGILAVPDAPLLFFWVVYLFLLYRVRRGISWGHWTIMGAVLGMGILTKYFAVLLIPTTLLFLASETQLRRHLKTPYPYLTFAISAFVASPIFFWNMERDWASFVFHLSSRHEEGFSWGNITSLLVGQMGVVTPFLYVLLLASLYIMFKRGFKDGGTTQYRFIAITAAPTLLFFYVVMCLTQDAEPHWPGLGYLPLLIAASWLYVENWEKEKLRRKGQGKKKGWSALFTGGWISSPRVRRSVVWISLVIPVLFVVALNVQIFYPVYRPDSSLIDGINDLTGWEVDRYDPTNDLFGWDRVAERVREIEMEMSDEGDAPFIFSCHYNPASQLSFALKEPENVYCLSEGIDQFDFWQDAGTLIGRNAIYVMTNRYYLPPSQGYSFERIVGPETLESFRSGDYKIRETYIYRCYRFKGMD